MKAKLKNWLKSLDANFPSLRFFIRKFPVIEKVAKAAGIASPEVIRRVGGGLFSSCSVDGLPSSSVFGSGIFKESACLLMGVSDHHPVFDKMLVKLTAVDGNENVIYTHAPEILTGRPTVAPEVVKSILPEYMAWFQMPIPDLPAKFKKINVRYFSNLIDLKTQPVPPGLKFCCLVVNRINDAGGSLVNFSTCVPIAVRSVKAR